MKRRPSELAEGTFDVLVIGAGIHGACMAREAALHGLRVAVVDRSDFGAATSANSQKVIHGGLRYLQKLNFRRVRQSVRERDLLMRMAPHLVTPLPFVIPTFGHGRRSRAGMRAAFSLCNLVAPGDPVPIGGHKRDYAKRILCKRELVTHFPELKTDPAITGGALWYDGQVFNTERLTLAFLRSAVERGAVAVNYMNVRRLHPRENRVWGASAVDTLDRGEFEIRAKVIVCTTGPWIDGPAIEGDADQSRHDRRWSKAWNIITPSVHPTHALGMSIPAAIDPAEIENRILFQTPWRRRTIIGTFYEPAPCVPDPRLDQGQAARAVELANETFPWLSLEREDVLFHHVGLLPASSNSAERGAVSGQLLDSPLIIDHGQAGGRPGVISVCGVKYTTGRLVAETVMRRVLAHLGRQPTKTHTDETPVDGGDVPGIESLESHLAADAPKELQPGIGRLARHYGSRAAELVKHCLGKPSDAATVTPGAEATRAEVRYAVREEMAVRLSDTVWRRTGLGAIGHPGEAALRACGQIMAEELGWSDQRTEMEIRETVSLYNAMGARPAGGDQVDRTIEGAVPENACPGGPPGAGNS